MDEATRRAIASLEERTKSLEETRTVVKVVAVVLGISLGIGGVLLTKLYEAYGKEAALEESLKKVEEKIKSLNPDVIATAEAKAVEELKADAPKLAQESFAKVSVPLNDRITKITNRVQFIYDQADTSSKSGAALHLSIGQSMDPRDRATFEAVEDWMHNIQKKHKP